MGGATSLLNELGKQAPHPLGIPFTGAGEAGNQATVDDEKALWEAIHPEGAPGGFVWIKAQVKGWLWRASEELLDGCNVGIVAEHYEFEALRRVLSKGQ
jgi:hypothetical protein